MLVYAQECRDLGAPMVHNYKRWRLNLGGHFFGELKR